MLTLKSSKQCSVCNKIHTQIPENTRFQMIGDPLDGFYWECDCKSTMFVSIKKVGSEVLTEMCLRGLYEN